MRDWVRAARAAGGAGLEAVLIVGSAAGAPGKAGDLDLLCLATRMDRALFSHLVSSLRAAAPAGPALRVETRIGPIHAEGVGAGPAVHLLIHDRRSWRATSPVSRCLCAAFGTPLWSRRQPADPFAPPGPPSAVRSLLSRDLDRLAEALSRRAAPIRRWRFDPGPRLVEEWAPASAPARFDKLLRYAASMLRGWALLLPAWDAHGTRAGHAGQLARIAALAAGGDGRAAVAAIAPLRAALAGSEGG